MEIQYLEAKNHEKTVKINNNLLHSLYSPSKEAERFVCNIEAAFLPEYIFISEPGFGYCIPFLQKKFPDSKIIVIHFSKIFAYSNSLVKEIYFSDFNSSSQLENYFFSQFSEMDILQSLFLSWNPAENIFKEENQKLWNSLKKIIQQSKAVLYTRGFFEKRWLENALNNLLFIKNYVKILQKTEKNVLIIASGKSLQDSINAIKKYRNNFFIICVSSAIEPLIYNSIIPDLCISTDGGFWAKKHLEAFYKIRNQSILALPLEASCQKELLEESKVLLLSYGDGISRDFEEQTDFDYFKAVRNGTVAGTALSIAKKITEKNIYFSGLDLHSAKGFQHQKPNKIEIEKYFKQNKLLNLSSLCIKSEFNSESLQTYENWFKNQHFNKIYRIIENPQNQLGEIIDISAENFEKQCESLTSKNENIFSSPVIVNSENKKELKTKIKKYIENNSFGEKWIQNEFPMDYILMSHAKDFSEKEKIQQKINLKNKEFVSKLTKLCEPD